MIEAILYTTNAGTTAEYAQLLGEKTGLPVESLRQTSLAEGSEIIYLGWVMAGGIQGYQKAAKRFHIRAACGVCMGKTGSQLDDMRKRNKIAESIPVFSLQGGFDLKKLHGIYRFMMFCMQKTVGKSLAKKQNRTADEDQMLDMMMNGADLVNAENLKDLLDWYRTNQA